MFQRKARLLSNLPERGRRRERERNRDRHEIFVFVEFITKFILPEKKSLLKEPYHSKEISIVTDDYFLLTV